VALGAALAARQPVACCTLVAPACAEALCTGVLSRRIDWRTLSGSSGRDEEQEQAHLVAQLKAGGVLHELMEGATPAPSHVRSVVQVVASGARSFLPPPLPAELPCTETLALSEHSSPPPPSEGNSCPQLAPRGVFPSGLALPAVYASTPLTVATQQTGG